MPLCHQVDSASSPGARPALPPGDPQQAARLDSPAARLRRQAGLVEDRSMPLCRQVDLAASLEMRPALPPGDPQQAAKLDSVALAGITPADR